MSPRKLKYLFQPIKIGNLELKNRLKLPAMAVTMNMDESISEQMKAFYRERAQGGVGLIGISCTPTRLIDDPMLGIYDDRFIPGLKELAAVIHEHGAKTYAQMGVGYSWAFGDGPMQLVGPSGRTATGKPGTSFRMGGPYEPMMPKALTKDEIRVIVEAYGDGARRARAAGFDAVEVIASVGYVIAQFLSPLTNKRDDEYGGSLENRMRLFLEIIADIKKKTGGDFPITCRLSGADLLGDGVGYGLEDTKKMAAILEQAGIAEIDVMAGWHNAAVAMIQTHVPQGRWVPLAEGVKSAVKIPVAAGTQIQDALVAERVIKEGRADMVYMARGLIADPELPNKAREGRLNEIRPCINCCRCIEASDAPPVYCTVNPRVGREAEYPSVQPAAKKKTVLVVGGGPSGMQAARELALKGHRVTLCEQNSRLGGALLLASITNWRVGPFLKYLLGEIKRLPIEVKTGFAITPELIASLKPDALFLALGGNVGGLNIPGADKDIVMGRSDVQAVFGGHAVSKGGFGKKFFSFMGARFIKYYYNPSFLKWMLKFNFPFKKRVIVVGGGFAGLELAETLAERGKQVTVVETSNRLGADIGITHRWVFLSKLKEFHANLLTKTQLVEITDQGLKVSREGKEELIPADTIVPINIAKNPLLTDEGKRNVPEVYVTGDCADPGKIMEAVTSGFLAAQKV